MRRLLALLAGALLLAAPAMAQAPVADLYLGYSVLNDEETEETYTKGFVFSAAFSIADDVAIPLELSWHAKDFDLGNQQVADASITTYLAGFRFGRRFYAQVLAGGVTVKLDVTGLGSDSGSEFALQPGLGIDIPLGRTAGLRFGGDYRRIFADTAFNEWRGHIGLSFYLGRR